MPDVLTSEQKRMEREGRKFEKWMGLYWGGISLDKVSTIGSKYEYQECAAQTAWEVWCKFSEINRRQIV